MGTSQQQTGSFTTGVIVFAALAVAGCVLLVFMQDCPEALQSGNASPAC